MIPFENRFHGHKSLNYVYKNGQVKRSHSIHLRFIDNKHRSVSRVAVVISKKVMKSAVRRNRIRRRLYEYIRLQLTNLSGVYDLVFIVISGDLLNMPYKELTDQVDQLLHQAEVTKPDHI